MYFDSDIKVKGQRPRTCSDKIRQQFRYFNNIWTAK